MNRPRELMELPPNDSPTRLTVQTLSGVLIFAWPIGARKPIVEVITDIDCGNMVFRSLLTHSGLPRRARVTGYSLLRARKRPSVRCGMAFGASPPRVRGPCMRTQGRKLLPQQADRNLGDGNDDLLP